jgi:hypothetical protein
MSDAKVIGELRNLLLETRDHLIRTNQAVIELQAEVLKLKAEASKQLLKGLIEEMSEINAQIRALRRA